MVILSKATRLVYPTLFLELKHLLGVFPNQKNQLKNERHLTNDTPNSIFSKPGIFEPPNWLGFSKLPNAIGMLSRGHFLIELLQWYCGICIFFGTFEIYNQQESLILWNLFY